MLSAADKIPLRSIQRNGELRVPRQLSLETCSRLLARKWIDWASVQPYKIQRMGGRMRGTVVLTPAGKAALEARESEHE